MFYKNKTASAAGVAALCLSGMLFTRPCITKQTEPSLRYDKKALCCDCLSKFIIFYDNCCNYAKETCEAPIKGGRDIDKINTDCCIIADCYCAAICTIGSQASTNEHSSIFAFKDLVTQFITCFIVHDSPKRKTSNA